MIRYSLPSNPNFTMSCSPEGLTYVFSFKTIRSLAYVTIDSALDTRIVGPIRVCEGEWLIPYDSYNLQEGGNFMVVELNNEYPTFDIFNSSCELRYYSKEEIEKGVENW